MRFVVRFFLSQIALGLPDGFSSPFHFHNGPRRRKTRHESAKKPDNTLLIQRFSLKEKKTATLLNANRFTIPPFRALTYILGRFGRYRDYVREIFLGALVKVLLGGYSETI